MNTYTLINDRDGNDTIVGAQDDVLLDGGTGSDTLEVAGPFNDVSDAQIINVETVRLTTGLAPQPDHPQPGQHDHDQQGKGTGNTHV